MRNAVPITIQGREVGPGRPPYIVAEVSANHQASLSRAREIIAAAAECGADAIKLQHYTPDTITVRSDLPEFQVRGGTIWDGRQLYDLYEEAMTPWEWTEDLAAESEAHGLTWFSTPFDPSAVDYLAALDVPAFKIASFEIIDLPLVRQVASHGKPVIISTGMATESEIDAAVRAAQDGGAKEIALLRCNSGYPADPAEMDLLAIPEMARRWSVPIGLSDHTTGHTAAVAATALGACIFEKHLTLRRSDGGPDAEFSAEPHELRQFVAAIHEAHATLGTARFGPSRREEASRVYRPSLRAVRDIAEGELINAENVQSVRPSGGLPPEAISQVVGQCAATRLPAGAAITWDSIRECSE